MKKSFPPKYKAYRDEVEMTLSMLGETIMGISLEKDDKKILEMLDDNGRPLNHQEYISEVRQIRLRWHIVRMNLLSLAKDLCDRGVEWRVDRYDGQP